MHKPARARRRLLGAALAAPLAAALDRSFAQAKYPEKPIRLILGYPSGGSADGSFRPVQPKMEQMLGQSMIVDYRPGAGATIAVDLTAKAPNDGYTLHYVDSGPLTIVPNGKKVPYDPVKDLTPIGACCGGGTLLVVHPSVPAGNLKELVALCKAKPGFYSYGTSGIGGAGHLAAELLQSMTGIEILHVPYKGGGQAAVELIGGQIPLLFSSMGTAVPHLPTGKMKAIGVTSAKRAGIVPNVPTIAEQGYPGYEATVWYGFAGPAGLPANVVATISQALQAALADPNAQEQIKRLGYDTMPGTPQDLVKLIASDTLKWSKVIREKKIAFE
ncbi:MAG TPA: tripartite tricarboxylate transporter substrate binding protein [Burkholderiales bacterium]|jgi:tripartite-type tricarboxylate transporter receptor subunit TctC|nr:tripartite tricarboxylate transporter substrate binding protein [Burkholderiales bacterium]